MSFQAEPAGPTGFAVGVPATRDGGVDRQPGHRGQVRRMVGGHRGQVRRMVGGHRGQVRRMVGGHRGQVRRMIGGHIGQVRRMVGGPQRTGQENGRGTTEDRSGEW